MTSSQNNSFGRLLTSSQFPHQLAVTMMHMHRNFRSFSPVRTRKRPDQAGQSVLYAALVCTILMVALCLTQPVSMLAQARNLSLQEAIETAISNNHELQSVALDVRKADAQVSEALGNALPTLDLSASYTRNVQIPNVFFPDLLAVLTDPEVTFDNAPIVAIPAGSDNAINTRLSLRQPIFNAAVFNGVGTSKTFAQISRQQLRSKIGMTVLDVRNAYYGALLAREFLQVSQSSLDNAEANFREVNILFQEGLVSEFDAIRSEVQAANLRPAVATNRNRFTDARNNLKVILGLDPQEDIELSDAFVYDSTLAPNVGLEALQTDAGNRNYDLQALRKQVEFNGQVIDVYRSEFLPTVELFGNYSIDGQGDSFSIQTAKAASVGLELRYNLFNGFRSSSRVEQAEVDEMRAREQEALARKSVNGRIENVTGRIRTAMLTINAQDRTIAQAQRGYDISRARYTEGLGSQVEVNDSEEALRQAKLNRLQYIYDYMAALAELEMLSGVIDERYVEMVVAEE